MLLTQFFKRRVSHRELANQKHSFPSVWSLIAHRIYPSDFTTGPPGLSTSSALFLLRMYVKSEFEQTDSPVTDMSQAESEHFVKDIER